MPDCVAEFQGNPTGSLGTVYAEPLALPGHGRIGRRFGARHRSVSWPGDELLFRGLRRIRRAVWRAIHRGNRCLRSSMRCANPTPTRLPRWRSRTIWRCASGSPTRRFQLQQALALELERRFPQRFIPRYSMVMFHHEIPYRTALRRGAVQERLLAELTAGATALSDVDFLRAGREVECRARAASLRTAPA